MPNQDPSLPVVIIGLLLIVSAILKESSPAIIRWIKSKANYSAQVTETATATTAKKTEIATEAQLFLSDVGKNYFTQLEKQQEVLSVRLSDYEKIVSDQREQLNKAFIEREKMRVELASLQEDQSDGRMKIAEKTSESVKLNDKIRQLEDDLKDVNGRLEKSQATIDSTKSDANRVNREMQDLQAEHKKVSDQLEEANRRLDDAYNRMDQERLRADRLEKENAALRKQVDT